MGKEDRGGGGGGGGGKGGPPKLDVRAAMRHGKALGAGTAVGVDRIGCASMTTGRMCDGKACDPFMEGDATSSDMAAAGR